MKKGEKTKRHIYECAIELFRTKGYDKVSVDEIVKCAGTAKGTFYIYFETKADILIYMLKAYDDYYDKVASGFLPEMGVEERLLIITQSSSEFTENVMGRDVIRVLYSNQLMEQGNGDLYTKRALYRVVHELIEEGQNMGIFSAEENSIVLTNRFVTCIRGIFFEWCIQGDEFVLKQECENFARLFCRAIRRESKNIESK